jgi:hypothetical protein
MKQITLIYKGYFENNFVVENVSNNFAIMIAKGLETQNNNIIDWYITDLDNNEIIGAKVK